jgi:hypothetical protein
LRQLRVGEGSCLSLQKLQEVREVAGHGGLDSLELLDPLIQVDDGLVLAAPVGTLGLADLPLPLLEMCLSVPETPRLFLDPPRNMVSHLTLTTPVGQPGSAAGGSGSLAQLLHCRLLCCRLFVCRLLLTCLLLGDILVIFFCVLPRALLGYLGGA